MMSESLYFVTSNQNKFQLYTAVLGMPNLEWVPTVVPEIMEIKVTEIASSKVAHVQQHPESISFPCFLEQSGLVLRSWKGLPGGFSQLFINTLGDELFGRMLQSFDEKERRAQVETIIYYLENETSQPKQFRGTVSGMITTEPSGEACYGWDRLFIPDGRHKTFAQMDFEEQSEFLAKSVRSFRKFLSPIFPQVGTYDRVQVRDRISAHCTLRELQTEFLAPLHLEPEALEGETITAKIVSLLTYCERNSMVPELLNLCKKVCPPPENGEDVSMHGVHTRRTILSHALQQKVIDFLLSLPNIDDSNTRHALISSAGLDEELQHQIQFVSSTTQFFQLLVPRLSKYGKLQDGRNAVQAVLESAKVYIGQEKKEYCDKLVTELYLE